MHPKNGVYRAERASRIMEAVKESGAAVATISYAPKDALLKNIAKALDFPSWFGANWDALEDCLSDLSWRDAQGHVLVFEGARPGDDLGVLIDVLRSSAEYWAGRGRLFIAVFVDPAGTFALPDFK